MLLKIWYDIDFENLYQQEHLEDILSNYFVPYNDKLRINNENLRKS